MNIMRKSGRRRSGGRRRNLLSAGLAVSICATAAGKAVPPERAAPTVEEMQGRRDAVAAHLRDGLLLMHSSDGLKRWEDYGDQQDAHLYYLAGLTNLQDAILDIDGRRHETTLFVRNGRPHVRSLEAQPLLQGM